MIYTTEQLVQLRSNNSSTSSIASQIPEIMEDGTIQFGRKHDIVDESEFIYGAAPTRTDLTWKQMDDLREAVHSMEKVISFPSTETSRAPDVPLLVRNDPASRSHRFERFTRERMGRTECHVTPRKSDANSWRSRKAPASGPWRDLEIRPASQKIESTRSLVSPV